MTLRLTDAGKRLITPGDVDLGCSLDGVPYITLKTVEGHLARVYGKLKISSRGELARGLGDERTRVPTL